MIALNARTRHLYRHAIGPANSVKIQRVFISSIYRDAKHSSTSQCSHDSVRNNSQRMGSGDNTNTTAFVSKHFAIGPNELSKVVGDTGYFKDYRLRPGGELDVKTCFNNCERKNKGIGDNAWKLLIRRDGSFYCHRCSAKGNWYQLKRRLAGVADSGSGGIPDFSGGERPMLGNGNRSGEGGGVGVHDRNNIHGEGDAIFNAPPLPPLVLPDQKEAFGYHLNLTAAIFSPRVPTANTTTIFKGGNAQGGDSPSEDLVAITSTPSEGLGNKAQVKKTPTALARHQVHEYLRDTRGLNDEVIQRYGVGCAIQAFPFYPAEADAANEVVAEGGKVPGTGRTKAGPEWHDKVCVTFPWMERRPEENVTNAAEIEKSVAPTSTSTSRDTHPAATTRPADQPAGKYVIKRIKMRALAGKGMQRILPKGGGWAFFGWHTVQSTHRQVVLTEGEYDAMAVSQALATLPEGHALHSKNLPAISLPNGCNSLPPALLPHLEQFDKIYLWLDNDKPGQEAAEKFARKLGIHRCFVVRPPVDMANPPKDANDALRATTAFLTEVAEDKHPLAEKALIPSLLAAAQPLFHNRLETFASLRGEVLRNIRVPESLASGTPTSSLPTVSRKLKGFRKGELVILTGSTGCGKTTLLSQMSLDFVKSGAATLWGSFEIRNARLLEKMLQQYAGANLKAISPDRLEQVADDFESLPMRFMNFHAGSDLGQVLEAMDFAVYRDDVQHIIIDNLQFMMPRYNVPGLNVAPGPGGGSSTGMRSNFDKFNTQDAVIDELRRFATEKEVNIILVIHPRKEDDNQPLGISSIFGTAKATQEADVVLILQRAIEGMGGYSPAGNGGGGGSGYRYGSASAVTKPASMSLAIKKNRYNGTMGKIDLGFNTAINCFYELDDTTPDKDINNNTSNNIEEKSGKST